MMNSRYPLSFRVLAVAALAALFAFRLAFGLSSEFFFEDETQIYLLGLRHFATGLWPYFGPDVVWTRSEIPGALQALLVGAPLHLVAIPEAPFVLLNVLSFTSLAALAWYIRQRLPLLPRWLVYGWLLTIPWTLQFSTHIINPSYVLPAAIVFYIGFFEAWTELSLGRIGVPTAFFMMGAALTWTMQIHMSWPLLVPYVVCAWLSRRSEGIGVLATSAAWFAAGALVPALLLLPTVVQYGLHAGSGGTLRNLHLHWVNPWEIVTTLARLFSFASLEINRFIATDGAKRLEFFTEHAWLIPVGVVVWVAGVVQPVWMLVELCRSTLRWPDFASWPHWRALRRLMAATVMIVYVSYWFVVEPPQAHAFYVLAPIAWMFASYCWALIDSRPWRVAAGAILAANIVFHAGLAWAQAPRKSLYRDRHVVSEAIRHRQPELFAHRRPFAIDAGPYVLDGTGRPYDVRRDVVVTRAAYEVRFGSSIHWSVSLVNQNDRVAFRDLLYITTYSAADGRVVEERHEIIKEIFEPGESRTVELNDGFVKAPFQQATLHVAAAEALLPVPQDH